MLSSPEVHRLTNLIKDSFRIRPNHNPSYVDVANNLIRFRACQHQVVFGRRGSGKSCLFVHFLHDANSNNGIMPIYIEGDEFKRLSYPDLLVRLLLRIFESMPEANQNWRRWIRLPNSIQKNIDDLRRILSQAEEASVLQKDGNGIAVEAALAHGPGSVGGKKTTSHEKQSEFKEKN